MLQIEVMLRKRGVICFLKLPKMQEDCIIQENRLQSVMYPKCYARITGEESALMSAGRREDAFSS